MKADNIWMIRDFIGQAKVLFHIPVYQRNYDWSEQNCTRLLDDIERILETGEKHFLGSIVFMSSKENSFSLPKYTIIDGQQRLTTMMILLKALADIAKKQDDPCHLEIQNCYLRNQFCDEEFKIKLKPIKSDNDQFVALLENKFDKLNPDGHICLNYTLCKKRLEKFIRKYRPSEILTAMQKLEIVYIELKEKEDDPQVIFESINSTGLDLSSADLIRNFLLMNAPDQEHLYENYWLEIEKMLKPGTDYGNLNLFFMQFIVYKTRTPGKSEYLYERFVKFYNDGNYTKETILQELKYYAAIFQAFVCENDRYSAPVRKSLRALRLLKQTTCYPFLLHVFHDFEQNVISEDALEKTLKLILTYLIRRAVCGVPTNSLRGLFTYLYNRVFKVETNKKKYYESINKFLHTVSSKDQFPSDSEFHRHLQVANIYSNAPLCKFLLMDIENGDGKETLNAEEMTIEHIMPQHLGVGWRHISEEDHEQYLHVLGNLSVTGYNSELSNKNFEEKKQFIIENSKAKVLNSDVWDQETWAVENIVKRGKRLADIVSQRYHVEQIQDAGIEFEYLSEITLDQFKTATGTKLVTFKFAGEIYRQNKFALMLQDMLKLLDRRHPNVLETLAIAHFSLNSANQKHPYLDMSNTAMRSPMEIKPGVFVESNLSANMVIRFLDALLEEFHEDKSQFSFSVIAEEQEDESAENED